MKIFDKVCERLSTEYPFIRRKIQKYGVDSLSFIVFRTNCKDNKYIYSFDNIFVGNKGDLVLFQMKMSEGEEFNPIANSTFPESYYPGLLVSYYDSFERGDIYFFEIKK